MAFQSRDLDINFRLYHLTEVDIDTIIDAHDPPMIHLDTAIVAAYGVTDEGDINEFTAIRVTKPAEKGDKVVFLPPDPEEVDRHSKERIIGETGEESSTDIYRGDISIMPGKTIDGITKTLLLKSQSGLTSLEIPDTPIPNTPADVYDANVIFEMGGRAPGSRELKWDTFKDNWFFDQSDLVTLLPRRFDKWVEEESGELDIIFDPKIIHINDIEIQSSNLRLNKTQISGQLPYPYENGKITLNFSWTFGTSNEREVKNRDANIVLILSIWDQRLGSIIKYTMSRNVGFGGGHFDVVSNLLSLNSLIPYSGSGRVYGALGRALAGTGGDEKVGTLMSCRIRDIDVCRSSLVDLGTVYRSGSDDENLIDVYARIFEVIGSGSIKAVKLQSEERSSEMGLQLDTPLTFLSNEHTNLLSW